MRQIIKFVNLLSSITSSRANSMQVAMVTTYNVFLFITVSQADSTSDIGSRLQQFDFRPDPCEDCDKRPEERPRRTGRDLFRFVTFTYPERATLVVNTSSLIRK